MLIISNTWPKWSIDRLVPIFAIALVFVIPVSSSGKSVFLSLTILAVLLSPAYRQNLVAIFAKPWAKAAILLFAIAFLACFWSPATLSEKWLVLEKYSKLLYLPVLVVAFQDKETRDFALQGFLLAMFITCLLSILKFVGVIQALFYLHAYLIDYDAVFRNHIMTGFMMSFAAYLAGFFFAREKGKRRLLYAFLFLIFSYQVLFVSIGRTGYVLYLFFMSLLMLQIFTRRQAVIAVLAVFSLSALCYQLSPPMQEGIQRVVKEWKHYQEDKNTSIGYRIQFHQYARQLFKEHPLAGNGTGSFTYLFRTKQPIPSWERRLLEPHSQYWLVASEFGLWGLAGLALFFISLLLAVLRLTTMRPIALALMVAFLLGNLSDSLLFYSGSGYFFLVMMALCLGEEKKLPPKQGKIKLAGVNNV